VADDLPRYGGIPLWNDEAAPCAGGLFDLDRAPGESAIHTVGEWSVEVRAGERVVVVRGGGEGTYEDASREALRFGQEGLDLLCALGSDGVSIRGVADRRFTWWVDGGHGPTLRLTTMAPQGLTVGRATIVVRDANGDVVPQPPEPPLAWHESFRYFRLSQASDDLFDAYRNAYLALESVLSAIAPQRTSPTTGRVSEGEGDWFRRALTEADRLTTLAGHVPAGTSDVVGFLYADLYSGMRSAMSHAKSGRPVLLPHDETEGATVTESLRRLVGVYLKLASTQLGLRRQGGGVFVIAFRHMIEPALADAIVYGSEDESPENPSDHVLNPAGGTLVPKTNEGAVDVSEHFRCSRLAYVDASELRVLPFVRRVGATLAEGTPMVCEVLERRLELGAFARFEAEIGIRGFNTRQPRERYPL
jgi:hypothetical protein